LVLENNHMNPHNGDLTMEILLCQVHTFSSLPKKPLSLKLSCQLMVAA
jgi:hypothetical protein